VNFEIFDPRRDPEPAYWAGLRERAGLRADWAWDVLAVQAWGMRAPLLVSVACDGGEPVGVVTAGWAGLRPRRTSFAPGGRPRAGVLHVHAPGSPSLPGWWSTVDDRVLFGEYLRAMRRELGRGCAGVLVRQAGDPAGLGARWSRPTEPLWTITLDGLRDREDWLRTLGKKRRSNLRAVTRQFEASSVEATTGAGDPVAATELLRLNAAKYGSRLLPPAPQLTAHLTALLRRPDVVVLRYTDRDTGALLGVGTIFDHPRWPLWRHWSMVPVGDGGARNLYFHHFGRLVEWALTHGKRGIVLGKGNGAVKASLGGHAAEQFVVARGR
jgi:hypothetical protein